MFVTKVSDPHFTSVPTPRTTAETNAIPGATPAQQRALAAFQGSMYSPEGHGGYQKFSEVYRVPQGLDRFQRNAMQPSSAVGPWLAPQPHSYPWELYTEQQRRKNGFPGESAQEYRPEWSPITPETAPVVFGAPPGSAVGRRAYREAVNSGWANGGSDYVKYYNTWGPARFPAVC